jgi:hypothetical protein
VSSAEVLILTQEDGGLGRCGTQVRVWMLDLDPQRRTLWIFYFVGSHMETKEKRPVKMRKEK